MPPLRAADVWARRGEDDVERGVVGRRDAERGPRADERRPDVEAASARARDPALLDCDEALDERQERVWVEWLRE
jgi:hypothetical protein